MLQEKPAATQNMTQEKHITVAINKKTIEEARAAFIRIEADLISNLSRLSSNVTAMGNIERLKLLHDFFRPNDEPDINIDLKQIMRHGHNFKDYICSDSIMFKSDYFEIDEKVGKPQGQTFKVLLKDNDFKYYFGVYDNSYDSVCFNDVTARRELFAQMVSYVTRDKLTNKNFQKRIEELFPNCLDFTRKILFPSTPDTKQNC